MDADAKTIYYIFMCGSSQERRDEVYLFEKLLYARVCRIFKHPQRGPLLFIGR